MPLSCKAARTLSLSLSLSHLLSLSLSLTLSLSLSLSHLLSLSLSLTLSLSLYLSIYLFIYPSIYLPPPLSLNLSFLSFSLSKLCHTIIEETQSCFDTSKTVCIFFHYLLNRFIQRESMLLILTARLIWRR